jgi:hypothetical protein
MIWHAHYLFHRRYGLEDFKTIFLNSILIFLILFYIYPLKFLATVLIGELLLNSLLQMNIEFGFHGEIFTHMNMRTIMLVYGSGVFMIWGVLTLLYKHAFVHRHLLELNKTETIITKQQMQVYMIMSAYGLISVLLAFWLPVNLIAISGWIYCGIGPTIYIVLKMTEPRKHDLDT